MNIVNLCIQRPDLRQTLLINRIKEPYQNYWGMPGGKIKREELPEEAAVRELSEETGIEAEICAPSGFCFETIYENNKAIFDFKIYFFKFITAKDISNHNSQEGELKWFWDSFLNGKAIIPSDPLMIKAFRKEYQRCRSVVTKKGDRYEQDIFGVMGEYE